MSFALVWKGFFYEAGSKLKDESEQLSFLAEWDPLSGHPSLETAKAVSRGSEMSQMCVTEYIS